MRVLVDAVAATPGGAGLTRVRELVRTFPRLRPEHDYLFVLRPEVYAQLPEAHTQVEMLQLPWPGGLPVRILWEHAFLPRAIGQFRPDIVFAPFNTAPIIWRRPQPRLAVLISNLAPYSAVVLSRCTPRERVRNEILRQVTNRTVRAADKVLVLSQQAFDLLPASALGAKGELVPQAPPPAELASTYLPAQLRGRRYCVVVADFYKFKGIEMVIRAVSRLTSAERPVIAICGRPLEMDYKLQVEHEAARLGVDDLVLDLGRLAYEDLLSVMRNAVLCVAPSRFENLSRVPLEAMTMETPVVAANIPSYREVCRDAALFFDVDDTAELAVHLRRLLSDPELAASYVKRGARLVGSMDSSTGAAHMMGALESAVSETDVSRGPSPGVM